MTKTFDRVKKALSTRFAELGHAGRLSMERDCYVTSIEDNLLPGVDLSDFQADLEQGDGSELERRNGSPPKFCALYSSAALVVNTFARFKRLPQQLVLGDQADFTEIEFESKCENGLRGNNPNLDLLARNESRVLGVESKFTEMLTIKRAKFSETYCEAVGAELPDPWKRMFLSLCHRENQFRYLDAAQLVKHALGLVHHFADTGEAITLLYLFWEPANADEVYEFRVHANEIRKFAEAVACRELAFRPMSYPDLWRQWQSVSQPLASHAERLRARYELIV